MANRPKITIQKGVQQTAKGWSKEQAKEPETVSDQRQRKNATYWDPREKKKISRKRQSKRDRKLIIIASLIMLATCAGLLFWNNWSKDWSKDNTLTTSPDTDTDTPVTPASLEAKFTNQLENEFDEILTRRHYKNSNQLLPRAVAEKFSQETDPQARLQWVQHPEQVEPLLATFPPQALSEVPHSLDEMSSVTTSTGLFFNRYVATFSNGERRLLCIVNTSQGPKADWKAYARHSNALPQWIAETESLRKTQEQIKKARENLSKAQKLLAQHIAAMPKVALADTKTKAARKEWLDQNWRIKLARDKETAAREELQKEERSFAETMVDSTLETSQKSQEEELAEVRVFVSEDNYYHRRFQDDEVWQGYSLKSPDFDDSVIAYVIKESNAGKVLASIISGSANQRMTLQLRNRPSDALHGQYQIEKVFAIGWVEGVVDLEEHWLRLQRRESEQPVESN